MRILKQLIWIGLGLIMQGCREQAMNPMDIQSGQSMERRTGVQYTNVGVIDKKIGLPEKLMHANWVTRIDITLAVKSFEKFKKNISAASQGQYDLSYEKFNPETHIHFVIRSDKLVVTDSSQNAHKLAVYLIPVAPSSDSDATQPTQSDLLVLTTLDGLPYSFLTKAQNHQAMFLYKESLPTMVPYGSEDTLTSKSELNMRTKISQRTDYWSGVGLSIPVPETNDKRLEYVYEEGQGDNKITYNRLLPRVETIYPCFNPFYNSRKNCLKYGEGEGKEGKYLKTWQSYPFLQPLAPIGVVSVNWHKMFLKASKLKKYVPGEQLTDDVKQAAADEIQEILRTTDQMNDIGWFGIPLEKRQKIDRLHYTQINFSFVENKDFTSVAYNQLQVPSIVVSKYAGVDMSLSNYAKDKEPTSTTQLMDSGLKPTTLSLGVDDGGDTMATK